MQRSGERGATLVHVAFLLAGVILFSGLVIDYGAYWVAHRQAQNAADAGALSGALARLYQDPSPNPSTSSGPVYNSIINTVAMNAIWGVAPPAGTVNMGWTCPDGTTNCVWVDVFRDGTNGSVPVPTFFLRMANLQSQKVRAHAVAKIAPANSTKCLKPWFVADRFLDNGNGVWDPGIDVYRPPWDPDPTGWGLGTTAQVGDPIILTLGDPSKAIQPGTYYEADLTGGGGGTTEYIETIEECIGNYKTNAPQPPAYTCSGATDEYCVNVLNGRRPNANVTGAEYLIGLDTGAYVDSSGYHSTNFSSAEASPRVVDIALFDPTLAIGPPGNQTLPIVRIVSVFVDSVVSSGPDKGNINGKWLGKGGDLRPNGGPGGPAPFLVSIVLIR